MNNKRLQLFIFPYAGASTANFKKLSDLLDDEFDVIIAEYPGRGARRNEPFVKSFDCLLEDSVQNFNKKRNRNIPYVMMGYSMGSLLAYETAADNLLGEGLIHCVLCAEVSPENRALELRQIKNPSEENIIAHALALGGLDEKMLRNKRFCEIFLKPMIADFKLFFQYRAKNNRENINTDATFLYSDVDTPEADVRKWENLFCGNCTFHQFDGGHFFINNHYREIAEIINARLKPYLEKSNAF